MYPDLPLTSLFRRRASLTRETREESEDNIYTLQRNRNRLKTRTGTVGLLNKDQTVKINSGTIVSEVDQHGVL